MSAASYWAPSIDCKACGRPSVKGSYLCEPCRRLVQRVETRKDPMGRGRTVNREARLAAMNRQWDPAIGSYRCHYTGVPLETDPGTRRYATWEHLSPGDESDVVLVADLVNRMKSDMTDAEFRVFVAGLAQHFAGSPFDPAAFPPDKPPDR